VREGTKSGSYRFDHAVVLVSSLEQAVADYTSLGFTVTPGGVHRGGATRNALIVFEDGTYLELLAYTRRYLLRLLRFLSRLRLLGHLVRRRTGLERRFLPRSGSGTGLIDFALVPDAMERALFRAKTAALEVEGPIPGGRALADGEEVAWELALPVPPDLPFLCADRTPRSLRVPEGEAREHENGVTGIASLVVAVENLEASSARYRALLGVEPQTPLTLPVPHSRARSFALPETDLVLVAPTEHTPALRQHLRERGEGPLLLRLRTASRENAGPLPAARVQGAAIELVPAGRGG
jgi:hypothetical protein